MNVQFGLTPELTNTRFAPVAALMMYYGNQHVLDSLQSGLIGPNQRDLGLANKLEQLFWSILTGCEFISMINTTLGPERPLAQLKRIESFADQSTLSRALHGLTQMNLDGLSAATRQISHRCSRTVHHDWRGFLQIDFDLSGLPCGQQAEGSEKGYFSGKKTQQDVN